MCALSAPSGIFGKEKRSVGCTSVDAAVPWTVKTRKGTGTAAVVEDAEISERVHCGAPEV